MECSSSVLKEDIREILRDEKISWMKLHDSTVLVTGATGLIGGLLIRALSAANTDYNLNMRIIAHGRNKCKGQALIEECGAEFVAGDIRTPIPSKFLPASLDFVFHCASITKSAEMLARPVEVIDIMVDGTKKLLELANSHHCRSFVYLSSVEAYGQAEKKEISEKDLGYLDLSNPRSCYPAGKRMCEMLCIAHASQYKLPVKIARLSRTFGAGAPNDASDLRVANQFARCAAEKKDVELHTQGNSIANCCYTADAIRGLLLILLSGEDGQIYNIANPDASTTILDMAEILAGRVCGGTINVVMNIPEDVFEYGYAPDVGFTLNVNKLRALGWSPKYGLEDMFRRMLADWQEIEV